MWVFVCFLSCVPENIENIPFFSERRLVANPGNTLTQSRSAG